MLIRGVLILLSVSVSVQIWQYCEFVNHLNLYQYISTCTYAPFSLVYHLLNVKRNMPRAKAVVWDYFSIREDSDKFAMCSICKDSVSRGGSSVKNFNITNLIDHLKKKHPDDYDYKEKKQLKRAERKGKAKKENGFSAAYDNRGRNKA